MKKVLVILVLIMSIIACTKKDVTYPTSVKNKMMSDPIDGSVTIINTTWVYTKCILSNTKFVMKNHSDTTIIENGDVRLKAYWIIPGHFHPDTALCLDTAFYLHSEQNIKLYIPFCGGK